MPSGPRKREVAHKRASALVRAARVCNPSIRPALTVVIPSPARDLLFAFAPPPLYPAARAEHRLSVAPGFAPVYGDSLRFFAGEPGVSQRPLLLKNEAPKAAPCPE